MAYTERNISYLFAFGIEGLSNSIYRRLFSFKKSHKGPEKVCVEKISSRRRGILCVEKIRSRPRGILCVDKIGSVPPDRAIIAAIPPAITSFPK